MWFAAVIQSCEAPENSKPSKEDVVKTAQDVVVRNYTRAIEEYIHWTSSQKPIEEDTLFIGKHPDFPDIQLPNVIGGKVIGIIPFEEASSFLHTKEKCIFLNIVGNVEEKSAEFLFVTFHEKGKPQHHCTVKLQRLDGSDEILLQSLTVDSVYHLSKRT